MKYTSVIFDLYDHDEDDRILIHVNFRGHNLSDSQILDYFGQRYPDCDLIDYQIKYETR